MGDLILAPVVDATISNLISAVAQQINLAVSWKQELIILQDKLVLIQAVLEDAGRRHVTDPPVKRWLIKLRQVADEADYILDEVAYESVKRRVKIQNQVMKKVRYFLTPNNPLAFGLRMAYKIRNVIAMVDGINKEAHGFGLQHRLAATDYQPRRKTQTHSLIGDSSHVVGREDDVSKIVQLLIDPANQLRLCVISIVGMPGLGKTTLAQSVRGNDQIQKHFGKIMWVCVSETFDVEEILAEMLESLTKKTCAVRNKDTVVQEIRAAVGENNYLLILDDVWNEESEKWEDLKSCLLGICKMSGNRVVVTTRSKNVTLTMETLPEHIHHLGQLKDVECWHIIKMKVFGNASTALNPELENIGWDIAKKCGGVPLVANVIGGTLCTRGLNTVEWLSIKSKIDALGSLGYHNRIMHVLQLSFDHLPNSSLKQCFVFCSIFPKDYVMEREILIQLWMAEGFLQSPEETSITMENIGDGYFNDLLSYSLFQEEERDSFGSIAFCKMHDLIHDFAQFISKSEMKILKSLSGGSISNFKHLNLICDLQTAPTILGDVAQLRTLFAKHGFPCGMSGNFKRLRVLNFGAVADTENLPKCFGNMKSLRYLDISSTQIKELPRFITNLYNLQTFRFLNCRSLKMPPKGIGNLINLRHIYFNNENCMPANLGSLTCLQTLQLFFVGATKGCKIEELGCLSQLRGGLEIRNLELVKDKSEAMKAKLHEKVFHYLRLVWGKEGNQDEDVLEGLQPDSNLQRLEIDGYGGKNLPSWMLKTDSSFNCQTLLLERCKKLECFPVMKGFSSLKLLRIWGCDELSTIADGALALSTSLKELLIENCPKLESVLTSGLPSLETLQIVNCDVSSIADILASSTCLKKLRIKRCHNLIAIPEELKELHSLVELSIINCSKVRSIPENLLNCLTSLKQLSIGGFSKEIEEFPGLSSIHHLNCSLESLNLRGWEKLKMLPTQIQHLTTLEKLFISHFDEMEALPEWLGSLSSLKQLYIGNCSRLRCLSSGLPFCTSLEMLSVLYCANLISISEEVLGRLTHLTFLVIGGFSNELEEFPCLNSIGTSLRWLTLIGWEKLSQLPHQIQHLTALNRLCVDKFDGVEVLPDWLGNLSSLENLVVENCKNLKQLPSTEAIRSLSNLRVLDIYRCPLLEERCTKESGPEWSKISHILTIFINGKPI